MGITVQKNPDGSYTTFGEADTPQPIALSKADFNKYGWAQVGMVTHQKLIEAAHERTGTADLDYEVRAVAQQFDDAQMIYFADMQALAAILVTAGIMTTDQEAAYVNNWPTA